MAANDNLKDSSQVELARRRLLRGSLGAVPVILTVTSPSVMAGGGGHGGGICTPASSFASINASRPGKTASCGGRKPHYWKQGKNWPAACVPSDVKDKYGRYTARATKFHDVFLTRKVCGDRTMLEVLQTTEGQFEVARYVAAALLNAQSGLTPNDVLSIGTVKSVWTAYVDRGFYEPTAGIQWFATTS